MKIQIILGVWDVLGIMLSMVVVCGLLPLTQGLSEILSLKG